MLTSSLFIEVPVPSQELEPLSNLSPTMIFLMYFGTVPTVWMGHRGCKVVESTFLYIVQNRTHDKMHLIQPYVIKFVSDLQQVGGFLRVLRCPPPIKLTDPI